MKYRIWEELLTEYTLPEGCTGQARLLDEVEAESHDEAYRVFLSRHPEKGGCPVTVKDGLIGIGYHGVV